MLVSDFNTDNDTVYRCANIKNGVNLRIFGTWTARGKEGSEEASGGGIKRGREGARGRGAREGRKRQGWYPEEGTGQCTVYSQIIPQRGIWP